MGAAWRACDVTPCSRCVVAGCCHTNLGFGLLRASLAAGGSDHGSTLPAIRQAKKQTNEADRLMKQSKKLSAQLLQIEAEALLHDRTKRELEEVPWRLLCKHSAVV